MSSVQGRLKQIEQAMLTSLGGVGNGEKGTKVMKIIGKGESTARAAAIRLAEFLDTPYELPTAAPRQVSSA